MDGESRRFALQSCCKGVGYKESLIKKKMESSDSMQ